MAYPTQNILLAVTIGAEVFAIAALWPLSEWSTTQQRRLWYFYALAVVLLCILLEGHGLALAKAGAGAARWSIARPLQWATLPLFIGFPDAVCVAVGQSLTRSGVSPGTARMAALGVGAMAVIVAPFAALIAGCGLAGACY